MKFSTISKMPISKEIISRMLVDYKSLSSAPSIKEDLFLEMVETNEVAGETIREYKIVSKDIETLFTFIDRLNKSI